MKKAIIVGSNGQDGTILYDYLIQKGYNIIGLDKDSIKSNCKWDNLVDISKESEVSELLKKFLPDEIYYFAAFHHSSQDKPLDESKIYQISYNIHVAYLLNFLESIRKSSPKTKLFYAASSLIFGDAKKKIQNEKTLLNPKGVYGLTKTYGLLACKFYRENHSIFASTGILYNHESKYRLPQFLSQKVISSAVKIKKGDQDKLVLGNLNAIVDWGYAPDYIDAMHKILTLDFASEFIIASGRKHTVKDFVKETFDYLGLDWKEYIIEDDKILSRKKSILIGDTKKLKKATGWKPSTNFKEMIKKLVDEKVNTYG